ncbi:hypothetical protein [Thermofilum pendens]|uniref:Uncharacterized protein n=1 Tax=Thermofilum pendens (strain DSM 2475 / Hrk 5) TaxID=368408 RepID=A1RXP4_THEPD|nr:hypothetical protein [Thermofilum pendens]ABL77974.1 hypothetical protein Tpen_0569 [Thermofilum pendens Hrk 5]
MINKNDVEKKARSLFRDAQIEVKMEGKGIKLAIEGIGEDVGELFTKIGDLVSGIAKASGAKDTDVIVSIQGSAYGIEIEIY